MIEFKRTAESEWEPWPADAQPRPPAVIDFGPHTIPCSVHPACVDWGGVHFHAIRFDGRVWTAGTGWNAQVNQS